MSDTASMPKGFKDEETVQKGRNLKGPWTNEEDERLQEFVDREGSASWSKAATLLVGRTSKQCRERWFNHLNPDVKKTSWSAEEDELIYELFQQYGSSWSRIAKMVPGRTDTAIKNRFYSTLRKIQCERQRNLKETNSPNTRGIGMLPTFDVDISNGRISGGLGSIKHNKLYQLMYGVQDLDDLVDCALKKKEHCKYETRSIGRKRRARKQAAKSRAASIAPSHSTAMSEKIEYIEPVATTISQPAKQSQLQTSTGVGTLSLNDKMVQLITKLKQLETLISSTREEVLNLETGFLSRTTKQEYSENDDNIFLMDQMPIVKEETPFSTVCHRRGGIDNEILPTKKHHEMYEEEEFQLSFESPLRRIYPSFFPLSEEQL